MERKHGTKGHRFSAGEAGARLLYNQDYKGGAENIVNDLFKEVEGLINIRIEEFVSTPYPDIEWPKMGQFSLFDGLRAIDDYIVMCNFKVNWEYAINFLELSCNRLANFYHYEVKWGKSTKTVPIPEVCVSVVFTVAQYKHLDPNLPVQVTFIIESIEHVFVPAESYLSERLLKLVYYTKMQLFQTINNENLITSSKWSAN